MGSTWDMALGLGPRTVLTLGVGIAVVVVPGLLIHHLVGSAVWRRTVWRTTLATISAVVVLECLGVAPGLALLWRHLADRSAPPAGLSRLDDAPPERVDQQVRRVDRSTAIPPWLVENPGLSEPGVGMSERDVDLGLIPDRPWAGANDAPYPSPKTPVQGDFTDAISTAALPFPREAPRDGLVLEAGELAAPPQSALPDVAVLPSPPAGTTDHWTPVAGWLTLVWSGVAVAWLGWIAWSRICLVGLGRHRGVGVEAGLRQRIDRLRGRLGLRRPVRVWCSPRLTAPVAFGLWRPTVVLPLGFAEEFDGRQQETMLAHELAHLAARDPAWHLAADVLTACLWWHPGVYLVRRRLEAASEQAADEASLLVPGGPDVLADCLVRLGRRLTASGRLGWLGIGGPGFRSALGRRVERLLKMKSRPAVGGPVVNALVRTVFPIVLVGVALSCAVWARPQTSPLQGETTMSVLKSSVRQSVAAAALTVILGPLAGHALADDAPPPVPKPEVDAAGPVDAALLAHHGDRDHRAREHGPRERRDDREHPQAAREREEHLGNLNREREELEERAEALQHKLDELREGTEGELHGMEEEHGHLEADHEELGERAEQIERELHELFKAGDDVGEEEAQRREKAAAELKEELEKIADQRKEMEERAEDIERKGGEFERDRRQAAERLEGELREVGQRLEQIHHEIAEVGGERPRGERPPRGEQPELMERLHGLMRELDELREAGRHDAAERVEREIGEIKRALHHGHGDRPHPERPHHGPGPEFEMRMAHLREAIDNLHAGGFHEQAEALAGEMDRLAREHPHPGPPPRHPEAHQGPPPVGPDMVNEMREEIERLRHDMDELRGMMHELAERGEHER